jgi:hypothetical protein
LAQTAKLTKYGDGGTISAETIKALKAGTRAIYLYGEIHYIDAFKRAQCTKYRYMTGGNVGFRDGAVAACEEGNEAT